MGSWRITDNEALEWLLRDWVDDVSAAHRDYIYKGEKPDIMKLLQAADQIIAAAIGDAPALRSERLPWDGLKDHAECQKEAEYQLQKEEAELYGLY